MADELAASMTLLDLDQLATVTGGRGCVQQPQTQQPQQSQEGDPAGAAPQGGNFLTGLDQFLSFFQSEGFQQILGGLRGILGQFGQQTQPAPAPQTAP